MVFFLALTPLNLAALGGGTLFTTITGCVCMGCYSGDQNSQLDDLENQVELQKDVEPLLKTNGTFFRESLKSLLNCKNQKVIYVVLLYSYSLTQNDCNHSKRLHTYF